MLDFALHYLHVVCAACWVGGLIYTEIILWPALRNMGEIQRVQTELRQVRYRKIIAIYVVGTIVTGVARAVVNGTLTSERLYSTYGVHFICGALVGVWMLSWWLCFPPRTMKWSWRTFYASFWVVLAFMFGMRFA